MGSTRRGCTRVTVEYEDGGKDVHEGHGGDVLVITSGPGTTAHATLTVSGTPERIAQLIATAVHKVPSLLKPVLYFLTHDQAMHKKRKKPS